MASQCALASQDAFYSPARIASMATMVSSSTATPTIDPLRYRAAREQCRRQWPDLFFASHFTTKSRRYALYALAALSHQLGEIMGPPQIGGNPPAIVSEQAAACCSGGSCEGESIAKRQEVCLAVIDHLLSGQLTGKPQLDAFVDVQGSLQLPRQWFEDWIKGMATQRTLPRYATSKRLSETMQRSTGTLMLMMARALSDSALPFAATVQSQLLAWGAGLRWCQLIGEVKSDFEARRIMLPLEDLVRHRLSERDIAAFAMASSAKGDERWQALMAFELDRVRNLFRGGSKSLSTLADESARRTFAAVGVFALKRLEKLIAKGGDPFAMQMKMSTMQRLATMPRVVRVVWESGESGKAGKQKSEK